ncbi:MAG: hypothetical protein LBF57_00740 [Holosporaceae bacterium]|jgi:hypothetical protein|nr:hypothetical protein [Holosporaceae bacterium]
MKKTFLFSFAVMFLSFSSMEHVHSLSNQWNKFKDKIKSSRSDDNMKNILEVHAPLILIAERLWSLSLNIRDEIKNNRSIPKDGDAPDITILIPLADFFRNASQLLDFYALYLNDIRNYYDNIATAQEDASNSTSVTKQNQKNAEANTEKEKLELALIERFANNTMTALCASVKASLTILIQTLQQVEYSSAYVDKITSVLNSFDESRGKLHREVADIPSVLINVKTDRLEGNTEEETFKNNLDRSKDTVVLIAEFLETLYTYYQSKGSFDTSRFSSFLLRCNLADEKDLAENLRSKRTSEREDDDEDDNRNSQRNRRGASNYDDNDDNDDDDDNRASQGNRSRNGTSGYDDDDDDDDNRTSQRNRGRNGTNDYDDDDRNSQRNKSRANDDDDDWKGKVPNNAKTSSQRRRN